MKQINNEMKSYIEIGKTGHFPLFFNQWIKEDAGEHRPISITNANRNIRDVFQKLAKHRTYQKKQTLLLSMNTNDRKEFVQSFMKVVEHNVLKDLKSLQ